MRDDLDGPPPPRKKMHKTRIQSCAPGQHRWRWSGYQYHDANHPDDRDIYVCKICGKKKVI